MLKHFRKKADMEEEVKLNLPGVPGPKRYDDVDFYANLRRVMGSGGGHVRIYMKTRSNRKPSFLAEVPPAEVSASSTSMCAYEYLKWNFGDNRVYVVGIYGRYGEVMGEYELALGDPYSDEDNED